MLNISGNHIALTRGDSAYIDVELNTPDGAVYIPSDGDEVLFTVRKYRKQTADDENFFIQKQLTDGQIKLLPEDTADMKYGSYCFDMEIRFANGDVDTFICGTFELTSEVT